MNATVITINGRPEQVLRDTCYTTAYAWVKSWVANLRKETGEDWKIGKYVPNCMTYAICLGDSRIYDAVIFNETPMRG